MSKKPSTSSTCSAASEGSASDLNEPDLFGQLPSVNESRSAKLFCESIGPTSPSTTMSEPSTQIDLEELTSSAAGSPASRGPSPGSSEAQKMTVTSGRSWLPLLKTYGLDGSLAKMCEALLTNRWASSAAFLTWKASDTAPSHLLFQLAPSMPRTDETGSGFWATPMSSHRGGRSKASIEKGGGVTLQQQVKLWPTPTTRDHKDTGDSIMDGTVPVNGLLGRAVSPSREHGSLNPQWVEWLMGYEIGHTDLKPSEMPSSRRSSRKSAKQSSQEKTDEMS